MNNMRLLGHVLLWIGFLSGAFVAVRQKDVDIESTKVIAGESAESNQKGLMPAEGVSKEIAPEVSHEDAQASTTDEAEGESTEDEDASAIVIQTDALEEEDPWSVINWPAYIVSLSIAIVGVVLLRVTAKKTGAGEGAEKHGTLEDLEMLLDRVQTKVDDWIARFDEIFVYDFHGKIDAELSDDLGNFADLRELMIPAFGLDHYALIMTEFALAERTINRIWCASADGYIDEVRESLQRASDHLKNAKLRWNDAVKEKGDGTPVVEKTDADKE